MNYQLNEEEKEILSTFERGEWEKVPDMDEEIKRHVEYANATHRKNKRINIRISEKDLEMIQRKAIEEGIPYQTLISGVIHKYISGRLVDKEKIVLGAKSS
jgi:predicted DNA binding CopG/RHH family protein